MRTILIVAVMLGVSGSYMAKVADKMTSGDDSLAKIESRAKAMNAYAAMDPELQASSRRVSLPADRSGHFRADARVDGRNIDFMVDTGASAIALTERDAANLGIRPYPSDYTVKVTTANGAAMAARARINSIDIGGVVVRDVDALVMPDSELGQNLLGMTFLSRLRRFEYSGGRLVLEQ